MVDTAKTPDSLLIGTEPAVSLEPVIQRFEEIASLGPDWDSYGAAVPSARALATARHLAGAVAESFAPRAGERALPATVLPLADGGLQLEWLVPGGVLEVDVDPEGRLGYLLEHRIDNRMGIDEADDTSWHGILGLLDNLFGQ